MAVALMPIGAIAVWQAVQIAAEQQANAETALLTATAEAASGEALAIASASGAVATLAAHVAADGGPVADCSDMFRNVVRDTPQFSFAGFVDEAGVLRCASSDVGRDLTGGLLYPVMDRDRTPMVLASGFGSISGTSVIVSAAPVHVGTEYIGFVAVSVPHSRIFGIPGAAGMEQDLNIVTFNTDGSVLSSDREFAEIEGVLPVGRPLPTLVSTRQFSFTSYSEDGEERVFAVVPIIPGVVHALGSRPVDTLGWDRLSPVIFPVLMLAVGLIVAFGAVNALVIRYIRKLKDNLNEFARSRRIVPLSTKPGLAQELVEIDETWTDLATHLVQEEAELENMVHEKNVLLKEVHHRVKNNLQLIASIVNLKIRRATSPEARRSLKEVQMRVMSIAAVHRALYSEPTSGRVRADELLQSVIDSTISAGLTDDRTIDLQQSYSPVLLYPDQAVPLLLMASEAVTNALKYMGRLDNGDASLTISLTIEGENKAMLRIVNTRGTPFLPPDQVLGSGLGRSLIAGFATQVGGTVELDVTDDYYDFHLTFEAAVFDPSTAGGELSLG
ncbi:sensor histidine kinase [Pararhodobacter sp. CCB-MM2]|uniref:sensor histidine kinase n=1 Tax=Pararhodobacter sp. CCB-MM2 TaxID=1786003 RepID=UPI0013142570|nr:histidine kinase dimerization/phosphoacceptor domain -containing protein [Pararhodobacter sp. CCB-MM2]